MWCWLMTAFFCFRMGQSSMGNHGRGRRRHRPCTPSALLMVNGLGALLLCLGTCGQGLAPHESTVAGSSIMTRKLLDASRSAGKLNTPGKVKCTPDSGYLCAAPLTDDEDRESTWWMAAAPRVYSALNPAQTGGIRPYLPPSDQGRCNTCVSFAVAAAAMASVAHALGRDAGKLRDVSPQDLHYCGDHFYGCHRSRSMSQVVTALEPRRQATKLRTSSCLPYTPTPSVFARQQSVCTPRQPQQCQQRPHALEGRFEVQGEGENPALVQLYVRVYGGVVTRLRVYPGFREFFQQQPKGVYLGPTPAQEALKDLVVEHAVVIVGYDNQAGFWLLRNSWGPKWGDGGYFRVSYAAKNVGLLSPADTFVIMWRPNGTGAKRRRLQAAAQLQPVAGKEGCFLYKAGPRDWLADVAYRYQLYSVLDLINNNTQLLTRLDTAPVGKTLLLCNVAPAVAAAALKLRAWKLVGEPSKVYGRVSPQGVTNQRGRLPGTGMLRRLCVRTDGKALYALQTQHDSGGLVTMGSSGGGQSVYTQCLDMTAGEVIIGLDVVADDAGVAGMQLRTSRRSSALGDTDRCDGPYLRMRKSVAYLLRQPVSACKPEARLCRRRLQASLPVASFSARDSACQNVQPPADTAFLAGFTVHTDKQRVVGLQVHWGALA